jgi:hypothetical protein
MRRRLFGVAVLATVVAVVTGNLAWTQWADSHSPATVVEGFYRALAAGDAPTALAFASSPPSGEYLTSTVLDQQLKLASLSDVAVGRVVKNSGTASVEVHYRLGYSEQAQTVSDQVELTKHGSSWRLSRVSATVQLAKVRQGGDRLLFAGRPFKSTSVELFPGALPVTTDSQAVRVTGRPDVRLKVASNIVQVNVDVSDERKLQAAAALDAAIGKCLDAQSTDVLCPLPPDVTRPVPGSLHGIPSKKLADGGATTTLSPDGKGLLTITAELPVDATWKTWDFNNLAVPGHGTITLSLRAVSALDDPGTIYWVSKS